MLLACRVSLSLISSALATKRQRLAYLGTTEGRLLHTSQQAIRAAAGHIRAPSRSRQDFLISLEVRHKRKIQYFLELE